MEAQCQGDCSKVNCVVKMVMHSKCKLIFQAASKSRTRHLSTIADLKKEREHLQKELQYYKLLKNEKLENLDQNRARKVKVLKGALKNMHPSVIEAKLAMLPKV